MTLVNFIYYFLAGNSFCRYWPAKIGTPLCGPGS